MKEGEVRYLLIMLVFLVSAVVYIDRSNISIAGTYLAQDYGISKIELGWSSRPSCWAMPPSRFPPAGWSGKLGRAVS